MTTSAFAQSGENQQIAVEGSLTDSSGNAIDLAGKNLVFYVSANNCYLYGETSSSAGDSAGNINHRIGSSSLVSGSPNGFTQNLFFGSVSGTTNFLGNSCSVTAADTRLVQVFYSEQNITATIKLGTVPYAHNTTMLNGKNAADFVQVSTDTNTLFFSGSTGQVLTKGVGGALAWQTPSSATVTASAITTALGYTPASAGAAVTSASVTAAYGYTPANSATVASQINSVSSSVTSLKTSTAASFSAIVSSQWTSSTSHIYYNSGSVGIGTTSPKSKLDVNGGISVGSFAGFASAPTNGMIISGNVGVGTGIPSVALSVAGAVQLGFDSVTCTTTTTGALRANTGKVEFCNGSTWSALGFAASGVTTLNGSTNSTQSFANGTAGTGPAFITTAGVHTLNIPLASTAAVTAGLISNTDYTLFTNKITSSSAAIAQVLGYVPASATALNNYLAKANNLSDLASSATARSNLGLGSLATKTTINLATDVSGVLPVANGGTQWSSNAAGVMTTLNASIGSSTIYSNIGLYVRAPVGTSSPAAAYFNNPDPDGNGARINVDNTLSNKYGLKVTSNNSANLNFVIYNSGHVGVGSTNTLARLNIASGSSSLAPLNIASGALLSTPIAGSIEFDGNNLFYTDNSSTRRMLATNTVNSIDNIYNINSPSNLSLNASGTVMVTSNANSSNPYNGAMVLNGGLGVAGNINSAGSINTAANLTVSGSISTSTNIAIGPNITSAPTSLFSVNSLTSSMSTISFRVSTTDAMSGDPYGMGVMSGTTGRIIATSEHNANRQAMIFSDTTTSETFFGLSSSLDSGVTWQPRFAVKQNGNVGIGTAYPDAKLHLGASSGTVPLKFSSASLLASATAGSVEFDGQYLFLTANSGARNAIAQGNSPNEIDNITTINSPVDINLVTTSSTVRAYGTLDVITPYSGQMARFYYPNNTNSGFLTIANNGGDRAYFGWSGASASSLFSNGGLTDTLALRSSGSMQFGILNNAYMTMSNGGNIGIGTNSPTSKLHVLGNGGEIARFDSSGPSGSITFANGGTNRGFLGYGNGSSIFGNEKANYLSIAGTSGLHLGNGASAQLTIEAGNVGIGTTSPAHKLDVNGNLRITGTPLRDGGDMAWVIPSDARLKDIRSVYTHGLREIASINTYKYNYKKDNPRGVNSTTEYTGVMAQEVQTQIPEAVNEDTDGFFTLNTTPIFWAMLNAIRELYHNHLDVKADLAAKDEKIQALEEDNAAKAKELEEIKARLQRIEQSLNSK